MTAIVDYLANGQDEMKLHVRVKIFAQFNRIQLNLHLTQTWNHIYDKAN